MNISVSKRACMIDFSTPPLLLDLDRADFDVAEGDVGDLFKTDGMYTPILIYVIQQKN